MQDSDITRPSDTSDETEQGAPTPPEQEQAAESGAEPTLDAHSSSTDVSNGGSSTPQADDATRPTSDGANPEPARSPAEAFADLAAQIAHARRDIAQVADYARGTGAQLQRAYDDVFLQGADAALRGLMRIDELIFKQTRDRTVASMHSETAALIAMLGKAIEGELRSAEVAIIEPQPGDDLDLSRMVAIANRPAPLLRQRRAGTVADIISRGYVYVTQHREQILKKAEVVIWRARDEVPFDSTEDTATTEGDSDE